MITKYSAVILTGFFVFVKLSGFTLATEADAQVMNPSGDLNYTDEQDIWAQTLSGSHYNEFWSYHFFLNDDIRLHITYSVANFGSLKSPVSGLRLSLVGFDSKTYQLSREYPIEHLIQDKEGHHFQLREGRDVWFSGSLSDKHELVISTSKDGVTYDIHLTLTDIHKGFKWDNGIYHIGNEEIGIFTHIPYAKVAGSVKINDKQREVYGTAYMDHTFQNQTTTRLMDSGFRFISHQDKNNWTIFYFMLPASEKGNQTIGHKLVNQNGNVWVEQVHQMEELSRSRAFGKRIPAEVQLTLMHPEGQMSFVTLSRTADEERFSVLSELSWVARRAARTFLGGEVLEFRGLGTVDMGDKNKLDGFYNFFVVE
ncbi:MAG: hypothetical protein LAT67_05320 [Balneolales bacterium]|nr:hypothetical protein [Balneolales bacterium]